MLTSRGLGRVLGDLVEMGYDARWGVLGAVDAGAPHKRDRIWIVAHSDLHEHRTNGRKEEEQGGISSEHRSERCAWGIGGTSSDSEILADATDNGLGWREQQQEGSEGAGHVAHGALSGKGGNQVEHLRNATSEGLPLGIDGPLGQSGPISESERSDWWATEPDVGRVAHGVAARVDRLKAIGNGQVSSVAALAWRLLS